METVRCFPAKLDFLPESLEFISAFAREKSFGSQRISQIQLALEEALVNVFNYAYPDRAGEVQITCRLDPRDRMEIEIVDWGIPFNVLCVPEPDLTARIEERSIGGLGVHFLRVLLDEVRYRREGEKNILTLVASQKEKSFS